MTAMATTKTIPARRLPAASTSDLIAQYYLATSSSRGRYSEQRPRQRRINLIVDLISERADQDDAEALAWYAAANCAPVTVGVWGDRFEGK